jgi:hypothetical protein
MSEGVEVVTKRVIVVTPNPCDRINWSDTEYRVEIDTDPKYEDLDFPIKLILDNGECQPHSIEFEPEDAEVVGRALIRAAAIRRAAVPAKKQETPC